MIMALLTLLPVLERSPASLGVPVFEFSYFDEEFEKRMKAAGEDVAALWELHIWCLSTERSKESGTVLRKILRTDPDHKQAHEALGHIFYAGQWFSNQEKLDVYKRAELVREAKAKGWVEWKGQWVDPLHLEFLKKGFVQDPESGEWLSPEDLARKQAGWVRQDLEWVSPEEMSHVEKGLWKCGEGWLTQEEANQFHAGLGSWWRVPSDSFELWSTLDRPLTERAKAEMEACYRDAERIFGGMPTQRPKVVMLRDLAQYDSFCGGALGSVPDTRRYSRFRDAFLTDSWFDPKLGGLLNVGVGYWDGSSERGEKLGPHAARLAFGLSLAEAFNSTPKAREAASKLSSIDSSFLEKYFSDKLLKAWFVYGAATYLERYYIDPFVAQGGNPYWPREWSIGNILRFGGLEPMAQVFAMPLGVDTPEETDRSTKLMNQAGLLLAFVLDGKVAELEALHAELKQAIQSGSDPRAALKKLEEGIVKNEDQLKTFAGI